MNDPAPDENPWEPLVISYDAAGNSHSSLQTVSRNTNLQSHPVATTVASKTNKYDGDGALSELVDSSTVTWPTSAGGTETTHYLRSSVTGNVIAEYDSAGTKRKSNVYAGSEIVAQQLFDGTTATLNWQHTNPVVGDAINTDASGVISNRATPDSTGINTGDSDPFSSPEPGFGEVAGQGMGQFLGASLYGQFFGGDGAPTCEVNGMLGGCHVAQLLIMSGSAAVDYLIYNRQIGFQHVPAPIDYYGIGLYGNKTPATRVGLSYNWQAEEWEITNENSGHELNSLYRNDSSQQPAETQGPSPPQVNPSKDCYTFYDLIYTHPYIQKIIDRLWDDTKSMAAHAEIGNSKGANEHGGELGGVLFFDEAKYQIFFAEYKGYKPTLAGQHPMLPDNYPQQLKEFQDAISGRIALVVHTHVPLNGDAESYSKTASQDDLIDITKPIYGFDGALFGIMIYGKGKFKVYGRGNDNIDALKKTCLKNNP